MRTTILRVVAAGAVLVLAACDPTKPPPPTAQELEIQRQLAAQEEQNRLNDDRLSHCEEALEALRSTAAAGVPAIDADLWRDSQRTLERRCDEKRDATEDGNRQILGVITDLDTIDAVGG